MKQKNQKGADKQKGIREKTGVREGEETTLNKSEIQEGPKGGKPKRE